MSLENGTLMCGNCKKKFYTMALKQFTCQECKLTTTARHDGNWHYCDKCGQKLSKCTMCGKPLGAKN